MSEPNPYAKAARLILWLVATGMASIGGLDVALEFLRQRVHGGEIDRTKIIVNALVFVGGVVLFAVSGKLAEKLADYFDE